MQKWIKVYKSKQRHTVEGGHEEKKARDMLRHTMGDVDGQDSL